MTRSCSRSTSASARTGTSSRARCPTARATASRRAACSSAKATSTPCPTQAIRSRSSSTPTTRRTWRPSSGPSTPSQPAKSASPRPRFRRATRRPATPRPPTQPSGTRRSDLRLASPPPPARHASVRARPPSSTRITAPTARAMPRQRPIPPNPQRTTRTASRPRATPTRLIGPVFPAQLLTPAAASPAVARTDRRSRPPPKANRRGPSADGAACSAPRPASWARGRGPTRLAPRRPPLRLAAARSRRSTSRPARTRHCLLRTRHSEGCPMRHLRPPRSPTWRRGRTGPCQAGSTLRCTRMVTAAAAPSLPSIQLRQARFLPNWTSRCIARGASAA
mmetsp:Transcript_1940/g.5934  ORF Transcript_1940/g.5934 Transcript_1940/m.5934 type:complete len:336 (-) Transcript_1940:156-1163(-)